MNDYRRNNSQYVQLNLKKKGSKYNLWTKFLFVHNGSPKNDVEANIMYTANDTLYVNSKERVSKEGYNPRVDLHGDFSLPKGQSIDITLTYHYSKNSYNRYYEENAFSCQNQADEDMHKVSIEGNYTKQFEKSILGVFFFDHYKTSRTDYTSTSASNQKLISNEGILWLGYMQQFGQKWLMNARTGFSSLCYRLNEADYISQLFPRTNVSLRYSISQNQAFTWCGNVGNSFPTITTLNSADQLINSILIKKGNPDQKMSKMYNSMLLYNYFSSRLTLQSGISGDLYRNIDLPTFYAEDGKIINSFNTNNDYYKLMIAVSGTYSILDNLQLMFNVASIHTKFSGIANLKRSMMGGIFELNYTLKNLKFKVSAKTKEKRLTESAAFEDDFIRYSTNIVWSKKSWLAELGLENIFSNDNQLKSKYSSAAYSYISHDYDKPNQGNIYIKLQYKFNHGKKIKAEKSNINTDIESAIMNAH